MRKNNRDSRFPWLTEKTICQHDIEITRWRSIQLRAKLQKGVYWIQPVPRGQISWNVNLLKAYLLCGEDSIESQSLLKEYLKTLPKSA